MKQNIIAAAVQISVKPNAIEENIEKCLYWTELAVKEYEADLVAFPETITTGFTPQMSSEELYDLVTPVPGLLTHKIVNIAKKLKKHIVFPTYERGEKPGIVYNSSILIDDHGSIVGVYRKTHPFPTENILKGGWTTPGREAKVYQTRLGKIGMIICYDGDFPELSRVLAIQGAEIIVRPSALLRNYDTWSLTNHARAFDNHVYFMGVNAVGSDAGNNFYYGSSMIIGPTGVKLAQARGGEEIISAVLDNDPLKYVSPGSHANMAYNHIEDRNPEVYREYILKTAKSPFRRVL